MSTKRADKKPSNSYSLRIASALAIAAFSVLLGVFLWVNCAWTSYRADIALRALDQGIAIDKAYVAGQGDALAIDPHFIEVAHGGDPDKLVPLLKEERDRRGIGLMGFANREGVVISRTRTSSSTGENAFVVAPQGRAIAGGAEHVASVEVSSFDPVQLFITTGRRVYRDGESIGALFANRLMDDSYAAGFSEKYLPAGSEVLFYTRDYGIYGSSISDPSLRQVILSYFNTDSDWIRSGKSGTMIRFDRDRYYQVRNVPFTGLEGDIAGGALILVPYNGYSTVARIAFAALSLAVFALVARKRLPSARERTRYYYWALFTFAALVCVALIVLSRTMFVQYSQLRSVPYVLYNSTLRLQPEAGVFDVWFERPITVLLDTGSEHINAVNAIVAYDPETVEVASIDTDGSVCTQFLEKMVDRIHHQVRIACGLPSPGFSGSSAKVVTVIFKPLREGSADVRFTDETMVLANDGLGTNVLRVAADGDYRFMNDIESAQPAAGAAAKAVTRTTAVYSPSHPNGSRWYASRDVRFFWTSAASTTEFVYSFDSAPSSTLAGGVRIGGLNAAVQAPGDGVFYFHLAPIVGGAIGPVTDYKVMIDTAPPSDVRIRSSVDRANVGDIVRFEFEAQDFKSGLQSTMYIDIDDSGLFLPVGKQTYVPFTDPGSIPVRLRVYDKAGNYVQVEKDIEVSGKPGQWLMKLTH